MIKQKGVPTTMRVFLYEPRLDDLIGNLEPQIDERNKLYDDLQIENIKQGLSPTKQRVIDGLIAGDNFSQIGHDLHLKTNVIYKLKKELQHDLGYLVKRKHKEVLPFDAFVARLKLAAGKMSLNEFVRVFICDYQKASDCPMQKAIDQGLFDAWQRNNKNVLFEDYKTKALIIAGYIVRTLFLRNKIIGFDYYHSNRAFLIELIKNVRAMIRLSPILRFDLVYQKIDDDFMLKFADGSMVRAYHQRGRKAPTLGNVVIMDAGIDELNNQTKCVNSTKVVVNTVFDVAKASILPINNKFA